MSDIDCIHHDDEEGLGGFVLGDSFPFQQSGDMRELPRPDVHTVSIRGNVSPRLSTETHDVLDITTVPLSRVFDRFRNLGFNAFDRQTTDDGGVGGSVSGGNVSLRLSTDTHDVLDTTTVPLSRVFDRFRNLWLNKFDRQATKNQEIQTTPAGTAGVESHVDLNAYQSHARGENSDTIGLMSPHNEVSASGKCLSFGSEHIVESSRLHAATSDAYSPIRYASTRSLAHGRTPSFIFRGDLAMIPAVVATVDVYFGGKIYMPPTPDPPLFIQQLLTNHFMEHIRAYNQMFAMTSFGAKVDNSVNMGRGPYVFKVSGQIYHWIGSLCPEEDEDTLNPEIVEGLIHVLDEHNGLVRLFRTTQDRCNAGEIPSFKIRLYNKGGARGYELPTSNILGGIVFEDGPKSRTDFDVIIEFYPKLVLKPRDGSGKGKKVTMNAYYKYQLHPRVKGFGLIFRCGRLFQQYVVTAFCAVEQSQNDLRSDYLLGLYDAISRGDREGIQAGSMIMLPRTFTGGPRYMYNHYLDALAICLTPTDRADIVCRVFEQKVNDFISFLKYERPFGFVIAFLYTIEFQKSGLPHCHTLLWVDSSNKIQDATQIDKYISVELPDPMEDPKGYKVVSKLMMHGPCGIANPSAACTKKGISFRAYINVEYCGWKMLIKYLFKYISKGPDRILGKIERSIEDASTSTGERHIQVDEIQNYLDGRFICPFEACWRIFEYPIHRREPAVQILNVHLENMQRVNFRERDRLDIIVNMPDKKKTTLTEWYAYNNEYIDGRHLTYLDFPSEFVWYSNTKSWHRMMVRRKKSLGRLTYVYPNSGDLFYFRMLQSYQKGCKSPIEVRTVNGQILPTYRAACEVLGLLGDDREWDIALEESAVSASYAQLRTLFAQILIYCDVSDPPKLWRKHWEAMQDEQALSELINFIYDDATLKTPTASAFQEKAIVCPKNDTADAVNAKILSSVEGVTKTYLSRDEAIPIGGETSKTDMLYPMEYLNTITFPGFPPHELQLKAIHSNVCNSYCISKSWTRRLDNKSKSISEMDLQKYSRNEGSSILLHSNRQRGKQTKTQNILLAAIVNAPWYQKFEKLFAEHCVLPGKESEFPDHHFEFISYNQLPSRVPYRDEEDSKTIYPMLADVQLSATPATYYYINPKTQEAENVYIMFKEKYSLNPPLQVTKYRYDDPEQEKTRNRQTLYTLLQQDPTTFKGVRFTCEAMITSLNNKRSWNYASCSQCNKASVKRNGINTCEDHGEQEPPT
ncbi:DNA helicase [Tanacetum coccineum]